MCACQLLNSFVYFFFYRIQRINCLERLVKLNILDLHDNQVSDC